MLHICPAIRKGTGYRPIHLFKTEINHFIRGLNKVRVIVFTVHQTTLVLPLFLPFGTGFQDLYCITWIKILKNGWGRLGANRKKHMYFTSA
jgi:hypothetical protein